MKKLFYIGAMSVLLLTACGVEKAEEPDKTQEESDKAKEKEAEQAKKEAEKEAKLKAKEEEKKAKEEEKKAKQEAKEAEKEEKHKAKEEEKNIKKVTTITPEEFKKLKKGMSLEEVKKTVGGKAKSDSTNQVNEKLVTYEYDGENGIDKDSKITLLFNNGKLDTIMEFGLLEQQVTKPKSEVVETDKKEDIKKIVEKIVSTDIKKTKINELSVNNYKTEEKQYIVLPHLTWEVKNSEKTTVEMLEMYSDNIAAKLAEEKGIQEITVFWEVPYHLEGENIAKFNYTRAANGMAKTDKWLAPVLQ